MGIAIYQILASLEPARSIVRMTPRRLTEKHSSSDEFNRELVILILPLQTLLHHYIFITYFIIIYLSLISSLYIYHLFHHYIFITYFIIIYLSLISSLYIYHLFHHYIFITSNLRLTSHPRSTLFLPDTGTPGTSREDTVKILMMINWSLS